MAAHHNINPDQLKMFMSAHEIMQHYQPLDADREGWRGTNRTYVTSGQRESGDVTARGTWPNDRTMRTHGSTGARKMYLHERVETADELWDRKREEAGDEGLYDSIMEHGVRNPISLGQERGFEGKPQVVGGHHRLAVMATEAPHELMPVLHYTSFGQALRQSQDAKAGRGGFKYT